MLVTITISTGNSAFEDFPGGETARILRLAADRFDNRCVLCPDVSDLFDLNGNAVGTIVVAHTKEDGGAR